MSKRNFLSITVASLFTCLVLVFAWVFFNGLFINSVNDSSQSADESKDKVLELFSGVSPGQTKLNRYQGNVVWLVHLSQRQLLQVRTLDSYVLDKASGCDIEHLFCALSARTNRDGISIKFTQQAPPQLAVGTPWFGGFVDPSTSEIYDLIGRAYQQNKDQKVVEIQTLQLP